MLQVSLPIVFPLQVLRTIQGHRQEGRGVIEDVLEIFVFTVSLVKLWLFIV